MTTKSADDGWRFDGDDYVPPRDNPRLTRQYERIFTLMRDGVWRTLAEIESLTGDPPASISAQLRHMRKARFGQHTLNRRHLGEPRHGLYEYQLIPHVPRPRRQSLLPPPPVVMPRARR